MRGRVVLCSCLAVFFSCFYSKCVLFYDFNFVINLAQMSINADDFVRFHYNFTAAIAVVRVTGHIHTCIQHIRWLSSSSSLKKWRGKIIEKYAGSRRLWAQWFESVEICSIVKELKEGNIIAHALWDMFAQGCTKLLCSFEIYIHCACKRITLLLQFYRTFKICTLLSRTPRRVNFNG